MKSCHVGNIISPRIYLDSRSGATVLFLCYAPIIILICTKKACIYIGAFKNGKVVGRLLWIFSHIQSQCRQIFHRSWHQVNFLRAKTNVSSLNAFKFGHKTFFEYTSVFLVKFFIDHGLKQISQWSTQMFLYRLLCNFEIRLHSNPTIMTPGEFFSVKKWRVIFISVVWIYRAIAFLKGNYMLHYPHSVSHFYTENGTQRSAVGYN